jgi:hypothetical protein
VCAIFVLRFRAVVIRLVALVDVSFLPDARRNGGAVVARLVLVFFAVVVDDNLASVLEFDRFKRTILYGSCAITNTETRKKTVCRKSDVFCLPLLKHR